MTFQPEHLKGETGHLEMADRLMQNFCMEFSLAYRHRHTCPIRRCMKVILSLNNFAFLTRHLLLIVCSTLLYDIFVPNKLRSNESFTKKVFTSSHSYLREIPPLSWTKSIVICSTLGRGVPKWDEVLMRSSR